MISDKQKKITLFSIFLIVSIVVLADWFMTKLGNSTLSNNSGFTSWMSQNNSTTYEIADEMPEYPGGIVNLKNDVHNEYARITDGHKFCSHKSMIIAKFTVTSKGELTDVELVKGRTDCNACNDNIEKAILSIPKKFKPGRINNEDVNVRYTLPVCFKSEKSQSELANR